MKNVEQDDQGHPRDVPGTDPDASKALTGGRDSECNRPCPIQAGPGKVAETPLGTRKSMVQGVIEKGRSV